MKKITLLIACINLAINSFTQNVGIGLNTPTAKLQINSTSTASRPLLLLSDSIAGTSNTIEFAKQSISNKWSLSSVLQSANNASFLRFGFSSGATPLLLTGDGRVGINNQTPATSLDVISSIGHTAVFNGGSSMFISLAEQGLFRGYIGSYAGNPEDVDFGTYTNNSTGKVHLTAGGNVPRLTVTPNGNTGIGTQSPTEKLDVNGSINISQTIKANGVSGQPGQVLSLNSNGNIAWSDFTEFKNHQTFQYQVDAIAWYVPAGVTRIMVEAWAGGGGGSIVAGGGGGGYVCASYPVTEGELVAFQIGKYGAGGIGINAGAPGGNTIIIAPTANTDNMVAYGGGGAGAFPNGLLGKAGSFAVGLRGIGKSGEDGQTNRLDYHQLNTNTFLEATVGGKGGDAGNVINSGSAGGYRLYNLSTSSQIRETYPGAARHPGGGGAGHFIGYEINCAGASGMVIIHY